VAEVDRSIDDGLKDGSQVESRLRDRLDHVANRSFTLVRALPLAAKISDLFA
jgi:hypothetical protein